MIIRYVALTCMVMQGMVAVGSEKSQVCLNRSNGSLRQSQGTLSKSQERSRVREKAVITSLYYASPCSKRLSDIKQDMMPLAPQCYYSDCP